MLHSVSVYKGFSLLDDLVYSVTLLGPVHKDSQADQQDTLLAHGCGTEGA